MIPVAFFFAMLASLAFAVYAFRRGRSLTLLHALTVRVGLSVLFFVLLMLAWWAGIIKPHPLGG
jgi:DUF2909 family protein